MPILCTRFLSMNASPPCPCIVPGPVSAGPCLSHIKHYGEDRPRAPHSRAKLATCVTARTTQSGTHGQVSFLRTRHPVNWVVHRHKVVLLDDLATAVFLDGAEDLNRPALARRLRCTRTSRTLDGRR